MNYWGLCCKLQNLFLYLRPATEYFCSETLFNELFDGVCMYKVVFTVQKYKCSSINNYIQLKMVERKIIVRIFFSGKIMDDLIGNFTFV